MSGTVIRLDVMANDVQARSVFTERYPVDCGIMIYFFFFTSLKSSLTKYPLIYYTLPAIPSFFLAQRCRLNSPLTAPLDVSSCPVNLQILEEDSSFSHRRQHAPGYRGGGHITQGRVLY